MRCDLRRVPAPLTASGCSSANAEASNRPTLPSDGPLCSHLPPQGGWLPKQAAFVKQYVIPHFRVIRGKCHCQPELLTGSSGWNRSGKFLPGAENTTLCWPAWGSRATLPASLGFAIWSCAQIPGTACEDPRTHGIHRTHAENYSSLSQLTIPDSEKPMRSFKRSAPSERNPWAPWGGS